MIVVEPDKIFVTGILLAVLALEWLKRKSGSRDPAKRIVRIGDWTLRLLLLAYLIIAIGNVLPREPFAVLTAPPLVLSPFALIWVWESSLRPLDKVLVGGALLLDLLGFLRLFLLLSGPIGSFITVVLLPALVLAWLVRRRLVNKILASIVLGVGVFATALSAILSVSDLGYDATFVLLTLAFLPSAAALFRLGVSK